MDYIYIRAWGQFLGSFPGYIEGEVEKARRDNAPDTAIHRLQDGNWATFEDIADERAREHISTLAEKIASSKEGRTWNGAGV